MSTAERTTYHHGDLRATLVETATRMLESGEPFSLRAVAREAGVSPTAPYRHFADRGALESAVAVQGFRCLGEQFALAGPPRSLEDLAALAMIYIEFALDRPAVFRLMFGQECDDTNDERVHASGRLHEQLAAALDGLFPTRTSSTPESDPDALAIAVWGLVHGLAFLHLDRKLDATDRALVAQRVRGALGAILTADLPPTSNR